MDGYYVGVLEYGCCVCFVVEGVVSIEGGENVFYSVRYLFMMSGFLVRVFLEAVLVGIIFWVMCLWVIIFFWGHNECVPT